MSLVADSNGHIKGKFTIPAGIPAGSKSLKVLGKGGSSGSAIFVGQRTLTTTILRNVTNVTRRYYDPLAQTFAFEKNVQLGGVDLWFTAKQTRVKVQIREVENGVPTNVVLVEKVVQPDVITLNTFTRILFGCPVSLTANVPYAVTILCDDAVTQLGIAEVGKFDALHQKRVTGQAYTTGVLLSSSNASTWTAHNEMDLVFRLLEADFGGTSSKTIDLGEISVENITDIVLNARSELVSSNCRVEYILTLPDKTQQTVAEDQCLTLAKAMSGSVRLQVKLTGDQYDSPVLFPGTQLLVGAVGTLGTYYSVAVEAQTATKAVVIYDAYIPSGANVTPQLQVDAGSWEDVTQESAIPQGNEVVEYKFTKALTDAQKVKLKLTLQGTSSARPEVSNIRLLTAM